MYNTEMKREISMEKQMVEMVLANGSHLVTFTKKDGTVCTRNLTRDPLLVPDFVPKTDRITKQSLDVVRVWDLDNEKFISLIPKNVQEIKV